MTALTGAEFVAFSGALAVLVGLGFLVTRLVCPKECSTALVWAFAPAVGAGLCSLILYVFRRPLFTVEFSLLVILAAIWFVRSGVRAVKLPLASALSWRMPAYSLLLAAAFYWALKESMVVVKHEPYGYTDGWAIWNSHARYLLRDGKEWASHIWNTFHADYPLLVPLMHARIWRYAGELAVLSGLWGILFGFMGVGILGAMLAELRRRMFGILMAFVLLGTPTYLLQAASQEADVPLSVFYLATLALICLHFERLPDRRSVIALAGFMAGCAAWTKNEGLLFFVSTSVVILALAVWKRSDSWRRFGAFFAGALAPLTVLLIFKMTSATHNDLFENQHYEQIMARVMNPDRYGMIARAVLQTGVSFGGWAAQPMIPILALVLLGGVNWRALRGTGWIVSIAILGLVASGYMAIYVITPLDLKYHLESSLARLILHLWPSALLLVGIATLEGQRDPDTRPPETASIAEARGGR